MPPFYQTDTIRIEIEESEIPWLKIFTQTPYKEMSEVPAHIRKEIYALLDLIEKEMIAYYAPQKINIASFGNYLPHVHWHIMARFKGDSYFPEPMWGTKQRESRLNLPPMEKFLERLKEKINHEEKLLDRYVRLLYIKAKEIEEERGLTAMEALKEALLFVEGEMTGY
jgi:diadenosine tetraphosphate (Ap4A) HIT family hydrolase